MALDWSEAEAGLVLGVNAKGQFYTARAAIPHMRPGRAIPITGSVAAHIWQPEMAIYAASGAVSASLAGCPSADASSRDG